jgi:glycosyltransferase involved in cell wall biosynthesis
MIVSVAESTAPVPEQLVPVVSVIMSMRNSAGTVEAAIRSILFQTFQEWELIVIDDGSSDDGVDIVRAFEDSRIRLVCEPMSKGLAGRLNQAVGLSRGEFIARMDSDDVCFPERLARQIESLRNDPSVDVVGCGAVVFDGDNNLIGLLPIETEHTKIVRRPYVGFPLPHPTWCGRASWFRNNPYDPLMLKAEDQDLLLRAYRHSRLGALDDVLLGYRQNYLDLKKILPGRAASIRAIWRDGLRYSDKFTAVRAIMMQHVKSAIDIVTVSCGLGGYMQALRLRPVPEPIAQQWQDLAKQVSVLSTCEYRVGNEA